MEARKSNICGIVQRNTLLRIPYFQRRYVWLEPDWKQFATDMESTLDSDYNRFLGAIILKAESVSMNDRRNGISQKQIVIDGQQRLITFMMMCITLYKRIKAIKKENRSLHDSCDDILESIASIVYLDEKPRLLLSKKDQHYWKNTVNK